MAATLFGKRTQAGAKINELGYEVLLQTALKLCCCIAEFSGATVLPRSFVRAAWRQAGRTVPAGDVTVNDFVQTFMPITTERLRVKTGTGDWFDYFKWNRLPSQLSNTDCVLQEFVKSRKIHIGALAFGAARRGLNESFHFEFVMQNYSNPNYTLDSQSDFSVLPGILQSMVDVGVDADRMEKAVIAARDALGVNSRTGYLCAPLCGESSIAKGLATYICRLVQNLKSLGVASYFDAVLNFKELFSIAPAKWQAYQIQLLLARLDSASHSTCTSLGMQCAGPGMVPLALIASTQELTPATLASDEAGVEQAEDANDDLVVEECKVPVVGSKSFQKWDEKLKSIHVHKTVSAKDHHRAKVMCSIMVNVLCDSDSSAAGRGGQCGLKGFCHIRLRPVCDLRA